MRPLTMLLDDVARNAYRVKLLGKEGVRIQLARSEKYLPLIKELKEKQTSRTFQG